MTPPGRATRLHRWRQAHRVRHDAGYSFLEWASVVILVGLIATLIMGLGLDTQISQAIQGGVDRALEGGSGSGSDSTGEAPEEP